MRQDHPTAQNGQEFATADLQKWAQAAAKAAPGGDIQALHWTSTGSLFKGGHTVGHLGFTGTSVWLDLKQDISVVLLTNRVYHGRDPAAIRSFRPQLHDAVAGALRKR